MPTTWILCTVGKSLANNLGHPYDEKLSGEEKRRDETTMKARLNEYLEKRKEDPTARAPSGELQPLMFKFQKWEGEARQRNRNIHLSFFATAESEPLALLQIEFVNENAEALGRLYPHLAFDSIDPSTDLITTKIDRKSKTAFLEGIGTLTNEILTYLSTHPGPDDEVLLNPTGGLKGVWVVWPLIALLFPRVQFLYSHESSPDVFELPHFPLALDFGTFEELHSILQQTGGVSSRFLEIIPTQFADLFDQPDSVSGKCYPNSFGEVISEAYKRRGLALSGSGSVLLAQIRDPKLRKIIKTHIPLWQNVWLGDQIPEAAEHSKGHSLRLMEFAIQAIGQDPGIVDRIGGDAGLYLLFAAIWLHDIGHSAINYSVDRGGNEWADVPIDRFPSLVRDWHAYSSSRLIDSEEYLPSIPEGHNLVSLIAKYHRQSMPLGTCTGSGAEQLIPKDRGILTEKVRSLYAETEQYLRTSTLIPELRGLHAKDVVAVEALLRFVDASDVQAARVSNPEYMKARSKRTDDEIEVLVRRLESLLGKGSCEKVAEVCCRILESTRNWNDMFRNLPKPEVLMCFRENIGGLEDELLKSVATALGFPQGAVGNASDAWCSDLEALSLADRILFKTSQYIYYRKHASVACCWYRADSDGLRIYLNPVQPDDQLPQYVANDIYGEVKNMGNALGEVLKFQGVFNALNDNRYQEK